MRITAAARSAHADAYTAFEAEDWPLAGQRLAGAAALLPTGKVQQATWFDAALAYKFARDWPRAFEHGRTAASLVRRGKQEPAFWNLGIAATMLREWDTARDAWAGYGLRLPPGTGEIDEDLGPTCVRIETEGGQEVVWAVRVCPTRARIVNVPFHPSRRFGEVVLHDGVPNGERVYGDLTVPVFDEIALFTPSDLATLTVDAEASEQADVEALAELFAQEKYGMELPSTRRDMCACCSASTVRQERVVPVGSQQILLAAPLDHARELLDRWQAERPAARAWANLHPAA
ncbi:tetratricopeptide repeat protein [Catellatospora vulcania]|uniref:tetratricopeptide repeat protein n=1 Tax=Catellatospora vulcania TaxID=1460450 RepID=UPI0012D408C8|nr:tetratricopeptide repeat protein [Catellatospora vulcania]